MDSKSRLNIKVYYDVFSNKWSLETISINEDISHTLCPHSDPLYMSSNEDCEWGSFKDLQEDIISFADALAKEARVMHYRFDED